MALDSQENRESARLLVALEGHHQSHGERYREQHSHGAQNPTPKDEREEDHDGREAQSPAQGVADFPPRAPGAGESVSGRSERRDS